MVDTPVEHTVVVVEQYNTKGLDTLLIKSRDHGVAQVVMQMRVRHQEDMEDTKGLAADTVAADMEDTVAEGLAVVTANQCGG